MDGHLTAWIARGDRQMLAVLPAEEPERSRAGRALAREIVRLVCEDPVEHRGWLLAEVNGAPATMSPMAAFLIEQGFAVTSGGLQLRVPRPHR